jgi:hypothetical protein
MAGARIFHTHVFKGILITYPTANELAASTMAYAAAKKRYLSEFRSAMPILIAIGLKQRPETAEIEEFRSAFQVLLCPTEALEWSLYHC